MNRPQYVLKFISGKYQGGEFPVHPGQEIIIGRSSELDMVLVEDMVSRQHSRIWSENGGLWIEDLGSTNGTFVNGEKVSQKQLKEGDRILIGTSIIKLVAASEATGGPEIPQPSPPSRDSAYDTYQPMNTQKFPARAPSRATMTTSISGLLEEVPLSDLLQLFSTSRKTGILVLESDRNGQIFLREGRVFYAKVEGRDDMAPDKAFYRMMAWNAGTFNLEAGGNETFEDELNVSTEALMMEGMRILDELAQLGPDVPGHDDTIYLEQPLLPPLRGLTPELLDTLQLIHNYGHVETILNHSLATDLETMQDIMYLITNEYIRVVPAQSHM